MGESTSWMKVISGGLEYLLDNAGTASILDGSTGGAQMYSLPETIRYEGRVYELRSVEIGAFYQEPSLTELIIPDCYSYIDEDSFKECRLLRQVRIGSGLECYSPWLFGGCSIETVTISAGNRFIRVSDDGQMILSYDGKVLFAVLHTGLTELFVPEGVETIASRAVSCCQELEIIRLPSSLRTILKDGIWENDSLKQISISGPGNCLC